MTNTRCKCSRFSSSKVRPLCTNALVSAYSLRGVAVMPPCSKTQRSRHTFKLPEGLRMGPLVPMGGTELVVASVPIKASTRKPLAMTEGDLKIAIRMSQKRYEMLLFSCRSQPDSELFVPLCQHLDFTCLI
jgi:hypothetical protein